MQGGGAGVGNEHVSFGHQLMERLHAGGVLQIQGNVALAAVVDIENGIFLIAETTGHIADAGFAPGIAVGALNFDHIGTQVCHQTGAAGRCNKGGKLQNFHTG